MRRILERVQCSTEGDMEDVLSTSISLEDAIETLVSKDEDASEARVVHLVGVIWTQIRTFSISVTTQMP